MSELRNLFESANVSEEKIRSLAELFISNPMAVMSEVQEMGLPPDFLQKAMSMVMTNPEEVVAFAKSLGLSDELVAEAKAKMAAMMPSS